MPKVLELFRGTGSIGEAFERIGWQVTSVDMVAKFKPTHVCNILDFEYQQYAPDYFDFVWGSPPCTEFSIAKTSGIRDIEGATKIVERTLEIIRYFKCSFGMENPQSGFLKQQPCDQGIPFKDVSYCKYGMPYRKMTRVWTDLGEHWDAKPTCLVEKCAHKAQFGYHAKTAQQRKCNIRGEYRTEDNFTREQLYRIPAELGDEIANAAVDNLANEQSDVEAEAQAIRLRPNEEERAWL